jgi:hemerythrin HHE cation binding domain-containing protein
MLPSELRDELLLQHASLRGRLQTARLAVERWANGEVSPTNIRVELAGLVNALRSHNLLEERTLRELVRTIDAWGPARVEIMDEAHAREHHDLCDAVIAVGAATDPREGTTAFARFSERLLQHMAREEETFLNASVLRDDEVAVDAEDG